MPTAKMLRYTESAGDDGDQLQLSSHPERENNRRLVEGNAGTLQVQPEIAAEDPHWAKLRNCGDTLRFFIRSFVIWRKSLGASCSIAADS